MMWLWFGLTVGLLFVEIATTELVAVWFAVAALILGIIAAFVPSLSVVWQVAIFAALSVALVLATRPLVKKLMKRNKNRETNLDLVLNHTAVVVETICNDMEKGAVKINGLIWNARSENGENIEKDDLVTVKAIRGNKAIVVKNEKVEEKTK
ncbi:MAG: NfeD family protein [Clostridia bacterium]|nr:NfeD family protein [Clostridia bacterium]